MNQHLSHMQMQFVIFRVFAEKNKQDQWIRFFWRIDKTGELYFSEVNFFPQNIGNKLTLNLVEMACFQIDDI